MCDASHVTCVIIMSPAIPRVIARHHLHAVAPDTENGYTIVTTFRYTTWCDTRTRFSHVAPAPAQPCAMKSCKCLMAQEPPACADLQIHLPRHCRCRWEVCRARSRSAGDTWHHSPAALAESNIFSLSFRQHRTSSMPSTVRKFVVRHDDRNLEPKDLQPVGSSLPPFDAASTDSTANREKILHDRAMEAAKAPVSGFAMTAFMMYMMGNQINIMTMMFLFYQVMAPFNAILNIDKTFSQFEPDRHKKHVPRTIFILGQCAIFGFLLYKLKGMGLLPTESSDWLAMWPVKEVHWLLPLFAHTLMPFPSAYGTVWGRISFVKLSLTSFRYCAA